MVFKCPIFDHALFYSGKNVKIGFFGIMYPLLVFEPCQWCFCSLWNVIHSCGHNQRTGADINTRWLSKAIYTLNLTLLWHQFPDIFWNKKTKLKKMTFFILFACMKSWFTSSLLFSDAQNYLLLHQHLLKFSKFYKKLSQVGLSVLQRHRASHPLPLQ